MVGTAGVTILGVEYVSPLVLPVLPFFPSSFCLFVLLISFQSNGRGGNVCGPHRGWHVSLGQLEARTCANLGCSDGATALTLQGIFDTEDVLFYLYVVASFFLHVF